MCHWLNKGMVFFSFVSHYNDKKCFLSTYFGFMCDFLEFCNVLFQVHNGKCLFSYCFNVCFFFTNLHLLSSILFKSYAVIIVFLILDLCSQFVLKSGLTPLKSDKVVAKVRIYYRFLLDPLLTSLKAGKNHILINSQDLQETVSCPQPQCQCLLSNHARTFNCCSFFL